MKIFELAEKLKAIYDEHGDVEVLFSGPNRDQDPYEVGRVGIVVVEDEDEYPEDYNMPVGFKFVNLQH
mgnify:CR=1 FL=1